MKTIEERAKEYVPNVIDPNYVELPARGGEFFLRVLRDAYIAGANEQKVIDEEEIKQLHSIMEKSASILGIGTKWFNDDARLNAFAELREMILNYLSD